MECNKDEAIRAKELAEKKMSDNDFNGARKIALKAQNLYPELENITQLLSICDVHCSAQTRILGSEKDWYGILQVQRLSDETTVKKQYRKLALYLHPDKNRFPGAESAFKLICEANAVLSDPAKKSVFDNKIRVPVRSSTPVNLPPHLHRSNQFTNKQYGAPSNVANGFSIPNLYQRQSTQSSTYAKTETFWTCCPFCSMKYQYSNQYRNQSLQCQKCKKPFMAYEVGAQGVPIGSNWGQTSGQHVPLKPVVSQPPKRSPHKVFSASNAGSQGTKMPAGMRPSVHTESVSKVREDLKGKGLGTRNNNLPPGGGLNGYNAVAKESRDVKNKLKKRGRKNVVEESSESSDTSTDSDEEDDEIEINIDEMNSASSGAHFPRRSTRQRQKISYNETDDDWMNPLDKSQPSKDTAKEEKQEELDSRDSKGKEKEEEEIKVKREDTVIIESDSDEDLYSSESIDDTDLYELPDPEFNDFDKDRAEDCFAANQIWGCYDNFDGMPRFFAKVRKVSLSPFELSITWLEAVPIGESHKTWVDLELPVGCGNFKLGKAEKTSKRLMFSHVVDHEKSKKRGFSIVIHPRLGETWAIFKDWDLNWVSDPENHQEFKYDIVIVLSEFIEGGGIKVGYLEKVPDFISLFQRTDERESEFLVRPDELYKFSHRIPSFKMSGSEKEGVPIGSFELDPASLPLNRNAS